MPKRKNNKIKPVNPDFISSEYIVQTWGWDGKYFGNESEIICYSIPTIKKILKDRCLGWKKIIPDENSDLQKGTKSVRNDDYVNKYKQCRFSFFLIIWKTIDYFWKQNIFKCIGRFTKYVEVKYMTQ